MIINKPNLLPHAKSLRKKSTDAEHRLWFRLRAHRLKGFKFKRQVPIGPYIADFICIQKKLIIELDGGQHLTNKIYDTTRTDFLNSSGYQVLRFWNDDVLLKTGDVLESIVRCLEAL